MPPSLEMARHIHLELYADLEHLTIKLLPLNNKGGLQKKHILNCCLQTLEAVQKIETIMQDFKKVCQIELESINSAMMIIT